MNISMSLQFRCIPRILGPNFRPFRQAEDLMSFGCLNGLFVLGRSLGFIGHHLDQLRRGTHSACGLSPSFGRTAPLGTLRIGAFLLAATLTPQANTHLGLCLSPHPTIRRTSIMLLRVTTDHYRVLTDSSGLSRNLVSCPSLNLTLLVGDNHHCLRLTEASSIVEVSLLGVSCLLSASD